MIKIVGVKFRDKGKIYHFDPTDLDLKLGDTVVVETERGIGYAKISTLPKFIQQFNSSKQLKRILKKATEEDLQAIQRNKEKEREAFRFCLEKVREKELQMKLVDVEHLQDGSKIIFYFTADGRIDFRDLVKDIASKYKTRIEMRQIGVRDEARMINGYGPCGRPLCCSSFLREFEPISIKMAKERSATLNPAKISGVCGRLMCCIGFESENAELSKPCAKKLDTEKVTEEADSGMAEKEGMPPQQVQEGKKIQERKAAHPEKPAAISEEKTKGAETGEASKPASFSGKRKRRRRRRKPKH